MKVRMGLTDYWESPKIFTDYWESAKKLADIWELSTLNQALSDICWRFYSLKHFG